MPMLSGIECMITLLPIILALPGERVRRREVKV